MVRIALVGGSGMIGRAVIAAATGRGDVRIVAIARTELALPSGARIEGVVADPATWSAAIAEAGADVMVIALGTTWRKSGKDEAAFRAVDQELVLECARAAKAAGVRRLIAVSSVGADAAAKNFYLRVKGEVEGALGKLGFERLDLIRPGLLRGLRAERRAAERLAMLVSPVLDLALHGQWRRYRSVRADVVARAILGLARERGRGRFVHDYDAIMRAARNWLSKAERQHRPTPPPDHP